jgi:asparagine synthase (glutamine-hydrolysing)
MEGSIRLADKQLNHITAATSEADHIKEEHQAFNHTTGTAASLVEVTNNSKYCPKKRLSAASADKIARILTLRYDHDKKPERRPLSVKDFTRGGQEYIEHNQTTLIELIKKELLYKYNTLNFKRISLALSSGIDSSFTLAMIRNILPQVEIECISMGFGDVNTDEIYQAENIARVNNCNFNSIIVEEILTDLPKLIGLVREPRWNLYHYYVLEYGKKKSNIFYSGDGGDELFGGYTFRYQKYLSILPVNSNWKQKVKLYLCCHDRDWVPDQHKIFGSEIKFSWNKIYQIFKPYFNCNNNGLLSDLDEVFLADFNGKLLYEWLPENKTFGKYLGLDIESIFLTDKIVEFATHIPWNVKYDPDTVIGKKPLRSILANTKGFESINSHAKKGYSTDLNSLWDKRGVQEIIKKYLSLDSELVKDNIISGIWLRAAEKKIHEGEDNNKNSGLRIRYISKILSILALEIWYKIFVSQTMRVTEKL